MHDSADALRGTGTSHGVDTPLLAEENESHRHSRGGLTLWPAGLGTGAAPTTGRLQTEPLFILPATAQGAPGVRPADEKGSPHCPPGQTYSWSGPLENPRPAWRAHPRQVTCAESVVTRSLAGISAIVRPQHGISGLSGEGLR
jgi:hypothetical protein